MSGRTQVETNGESDCVITTKQYLLHVCNESLRISNYKNFYTNRSIKNLQKKKKNNKNEVNASNGKVLNSKTILCDFSNAFD